ncbi:alpha/beta fold hydrolase [Actinacidiphila acididurans]|uniref:Alpha/beta hydrolase n=1 Tax=Actinacidiphila acididurans TaxID=2784346 RepID=A0ABS2TQF3_9ACTN|nr:alpha/beta hydrolase [Actinacidiphila acididurans]MBM9504500.1 alpha/beta hydrolase [Actinacidiphila acididurans]
MPYALFAEHVDRRQSDGLSYLERRADSATLTFLFHGLGLDATDYLGYLNGHSSHSIAVNLRGYEPEAAAGAAPVPLGDHVAMVADFVEHVSRRNADKSVVLVGFSLGADLVLQLAEHWRRPGGRPPRVGATVLLDPNVNRSTMTISRLFAEADPGDPVPAFKQLINLAPDRNGFRALCQYLIKVAPKDFGQVRQLSQDTIRYWEPSGYEQFGARLHNVAEIAGQVRLVLSAPYEEHLPAMRTAIRRHGDEERVSVRLTPLDHFELIGEETLAGELAEYTR